MRSLRDDPLCDSTVCLVTASLACIQVTLDSQKQEEPFQVSLDLGSLAPAAQSTEGLPKGRLRALLPACRYIIRTFFISHEN